jgi:hypothetical protein
MKTVRRNSPQKEAAFLRAEGRFAVAVGGLLMVLGFVVAIALGFASLSGGLASWVPAAAAAPPIGLGWLSLCYGAWRFEQALSVKRGARPAKLHLNASALRLRAFGQGRGVQAAKPAARPEDQAHWKL